MIQWRSEGELPRLEAPLADLPQHVGAQVGQRVYEMERLLLQYPTQGAQRAALDRHMARIQELVTAMEQEERADVWYRWAAQSGRRIIEDWVYGRVAA